MITNLESNCKMIFYNILKIHLEKVDETQSSKGLAMLLLNDIKNAKQINSEEWQNRLWYKLLVEKIIRLISPLL